MTNLIILLILKGLIYGAALIGTGHFKGRSLKTENIYDIFSTSESKSNDNNHSNFIRGPMKINESELLLFLSYLMGETTQNYDCLKRVACTDTKKSTEYLKAAKMFISIVKQLKE